MCANLKYYPVIRLEGMGKTKKVLRQDSRYLGRDSNPLPPEYTAGIPHINRYF
jgi:hypothetical protein